MFISGQRLNWNLETVENENHERRDQCYTRVRIHRVETIWFD